MKETPQNLNRNAGFTLIELLTVIAIIAVLAAILFPVFNSVRRQVRQNTTMSQLREISQALKLYRLDNEKFPAALLGYAQFQDNNGFHFYTGGGETVVTPAQLEYRPLTTSQKYLKDVDVFVCPDNRNTDPKAVTAAIYPDKAAGGLAGQPVQFNDVIQKNAGVKKDPSTQQYPYTGQPAYFYLRDSYDIGPKLDSEGKATLNNGQPVMELHYSLDWTGVYADPADAPNQLKYPNAPENSTVVTWNTHHAAFGGSDKILVLMLNGTVKAVPFNDFLSKGPLNYKP